MLTFTCYIQVYNTLYMKPSKWLWQCIMGWNSSTFGSKVYPPIMCITFLGYISVVPVSLFPGIHFSCIPVWLFDLPTQSDTSIHYIILSEINQNTTWQTCTDSKYFVLRSLYLCERINVNFNSKNNSLIF